jgi:hypothetical protein
VEAITGGAEPGLDPPLAVAQQPGRLALEPADGQRLAAEMLQPRERLFDSSCQLIIRPEALDPLATIQPKPQLVDDPPPAADLAADEPLPP